MLEASPLKSTDYRQSQRKSPCEEIRRVTLAHADETNPYVLRPPVSAQREAAAALLAEHGGGPS
jgi:hypothetical protein